MLDDLKYIHQRDQQDALGLAEKQYQQLAQDFEVPESTQPRNIVFAGMGGSALAALISKSWPGYNIPFEVIRHYDLPTYVSADSLVIVSSYSGNTEEAVSCLEQALAGPGQTVVIAGGGKLVDMATEAGVATVILPKASQPRYAVLYALKALVGVLEAEHLVDAAQMKTEIADAAKHIEESVKDWLPAVPSSNNPAKQLAKEMVGKTPVIYGGTLTAPIAYKWKISFNENAKNVAWCGEYPEFNHNEFIGWSGHPVDKPYEVIDLVSSFEHPRTQKRFALSDKLLSGKRPKSHVVQLEGDTKLKQLLWGMTYGDFVTIYTALLNGVNPTPVDLVEKFKKELG